jgi:AraC-like DNA-binding protein
VKRPNAHIGVAKVDAKGIIVQEIDSFLHSTQVKRVYFADDSVAPPSVAYVTNFPRLSIPLKGRHAMELARNGRLETIQPVRGQAVFVPGHAWNRPDWAGPVEVLTLLFGVKQIGISLVRHTAGGELAADALKTSVPGVRDGLTQNILSALLKVASETQKTSLARLLVEALLHSCLAALTSMEAPHRRKALRTYELMCLYVQERFQSPLTRESVAQHFAVSPSHVSRLFRREGLMRFNDYLNLVRVNRAKFILRNYGVALKEVASSCGYSDTAYFCRVFKRIGKATPTEYRNAVVPLPAASVPRTG